METTITPPTIVGVCLADYPQREHHYPHEEHQNMNPALNSSRMLRCNLYKNGREKLKVADFVRMALETNVDWIVLVARRYFVGRSKQARSLRLRINYGAGFETLVLLDGASMHSLDDILDTSATKMLYMESVIAHQKSQESQELNDSRPEDYGVVTVNADTTSTCNNTRLSWLHWLPVCLRRR